MITAPRTAADNAWSTILARAATAADHANILEARARAAGPGDTAALVAGYKAARAANLHTSLNRLNISASRIADLALVVAAGPTGVSAHRLDGGSRRYLGNHGLLVAAATSRYAVADARAVLVATLRGVAVVRAAQARPVDLSDSEAVPLAVIERAMAPGGEYDGCTTWPGSAVALRVSQMWRLVDYVRVPPVSTMHWSGKLGGCVYRLTDAGRAALDRHRKGMTTATASMTPTVAEVLAEVGRSRSRLGVDPAQLKRTGVQRGLQAGWLVETEPVPGTRRIHVQLTDAGRDALAARQFQQRNAEPVEKRLTEPVGRLQPGMWVRLANRHRTAGLGSEFVRVHEVRSTQASTHRRLAHNYEVWATAEGRPEPFLYTGQAHFRTVRFEVQPPAGG